MALDRHICFGLSETEERLMQQVHEWNMDVVRHMNDLKEDGIREILLEAVDMLLAKENPTWSDYRFLADIKRRIDDVLG